MIIIRLVLLISMLWVRQYHLVGCKSMSQCKDISFTCTYAMYTPYVLYIIYRLKMGNPNFNIVTETTPKALKIECRGHKSNNCMWLQTTNC